MVSVQKTTDAFRLEKKACVIKSCIQPGIYSYSAARVHPIGCSTYICGPFEVSVVTTAKLGSQ